MDFWSRQCWQSYPDRHQVQSFGVHYWTNVSSDRFQRSASCTLSIQSLPITNKCIKVINQSIATSLLFNTHWDPLQDGFGPSSICSSGDMRRPSPFQPHHSITSWTQWTPIFSLTHWPKKKKKVTLQKKNPYIVNFIVYFLG